MYQLTTSDLVIRLADGAYLPNDRANSDRKQYEDWLAAGNTPQSAPALTFDELQAGVVVKLQKRLDDFAGTRGYDGIMSACTYATSTVAQFRIEGQYCVEARDATWTACYAGLAAIESGQEPVPSSVDEAITRLQLPTLAWPA